MDSIYKSIIEALIFSSDDPIPAEEIIKAIQEIDGLDTSISNTDVENAVNSLNRSAISRSISSTSLDNASILNR